MRFAQTVVWSRPRLATVPNPVSSSRRDEGKLSLLSYAALNSAADLLSFAGLELERVAFRRHPRSLDLAHRWTLLLFLS